MAPLFTDATRVTVSTDAVVGLRNAIIDMVLLTSTADQAVVAPILNHMLLSVRVAVTGSAIRKYAVRTPSTLTTTLTAVIASTATRVCFQLNTAPIFVDPATFTILDFVGVSTAPI